MTTRDRSQTFRWLPPFVALLFGLGICFPAASVGQEVANDPEILVQLEATRDMAAGTAKWSYSLARMSAIWMRVRLDDVIVWEVDGYWQRPRSADDPYMENFGSRN